MVGAQPSRGRPLAYKLSAMLLASGYAALFSLLLGLVGPARDAGGGEEIHRIHHLGAVIFITVLLAGLLAQLQASERRVSAFQQALLALAAVVVTNLIIGDPDNHGGNVGIIDPVVLLLVAPVAILVVLHPARRTLLHLDIRVRPASALLALLGTGPLIVYGINQALLQRNSWPPASDPHHNGHWMAMAIMAFTIAFTGLLAPFKLDDWRLPTWSAGIGVALFGFGSIVMPELASSVGRTWGTLGLFGGVLFIVVNTWEAREMQRRGRLSARYHPQRPGP